MNFKSWTNTRDGKNHKIWKYSDRELYMIMVWESNEYKKDDSGNIQEIMRWSGHVRIGNQNVDVNEYVKCEEMSKEEGFKEIKNWALDIMHNFDENNFEKMLDKYEIHESSLVEYEEYVENNK